MPITKRQFELGIDEDIQSRMHQIYDLLAANRDLAYSSEELRHKLLGDSYDSSQKANQERALDVLAQIGALDKRWVADTAYFAFDQEFDTDSWQPKIEISL